MRNKELKKHALNELVARYKKAKKQSTKNKLFNYVYHNYTLSFEEFKKLTIGE